MKRKMDGMEIQEICRRVRAARPLVHNITNYVAMNFTANALLAIGASPLMSFEPDEMEDITAASSALVVNVGCLDREQMKAVRIAVTAACKRGIPWILDPAGVGVSSMRRSFLGELLSSCPPTAVRGNASEILTLAGYVGVGCGVDSAVSSSDAVGEAKSLATRLGTIVALSGEVDYVTDGAVTEKVEGGCALMSRVTAMGCAATALSGAFLAVESNPYKALCGAMGLMSLAGTLAGSRCSSPGSFIIGFIDALYEIAEG